MKKITILFLILFISSIYTASSLKTFEINETGKLSLDLEVEDPDEDVLIYTFTDPLDKNGEWQTTYGDGGEYTVTVTVSDGETEVSEDITVIVYRTEAKPVIDDFDPIEDFIDIDETGSIIFKVKASDLNNDELTYKWLLNGEDVSNNEEILFDTDYDNSGEYKIRVVISDGIFNTVREWDVNVNDVDLDGILDQIADVTILETETVSIKLPNFKKLGLNFEISDPLGKDNKWKTDFDDAGEYVVKITAEGRNFKGEEDVRVIVKNNDRAPKFVDLSNIRVNENNEVRIELQANDPDDDTVSFSAENMPENAKLEGNVFTWTPGFDFVQKNTGFDRFLEKLRLLRKSISVDFMAKSNELSDEKTIRIAIKDSNRPFTFEVDDIEVDEGEEIVIEPSYQDPDNDIVKFSYSGFMNRNKKNTGFEDAGNYVVKVTATDGFFTETKFADVEINDVNRKPKLNVINNVRVKEGGKVKIELKATDPDNDAVSFSADDMPQGARLKDNLFVFEPDFDVVEGIEKEFSVNFIADDGNDEDEQLVKIIVLNVNKAPEIVSSSDDLIAFRGKPILFEVNAEDIDGDELTYAWNFGFFDKFDDANQHQRIFSSTGKKKVEVTVSDGTETVSKVWNVEVV